MFVTYKGKRYWVSWLGGKPRVWVNYVNRYKTWIERPLQRDSRRSQAVIAQAMEEMKHDNADTSKRRRA